uniref:Putative cdna KIAA0539 variant 5 n=1 Tax=Taeniopygia guttata TaxID=59729 RepID=B5FZ87_TAEGU|nr:putative cdna KIAA0539 variant 5 [Taeniopygia guttata]
MLAVLMEGGDGLDEEIGFSLNEDVIIQTFLFSAVVSFFIRTPQYAVASV